MMAKHRGVCDNPRLRRRLAADRDWLLRDGGPAPGGCVSPDPLVLHPHARPHRRRARAAGRHGLHHRRGDDRPARGVIGVRNEQAIESLRTHMSVRFETVEEDPWLKGVLVRCADAPVRAESIEQLLPWQDRPAT